MKKASAIREDVHSLFLLVYIIVVSVVASQGDERAQAQSVGKEDLSSCIQPHLSDNSISPYACLSTNTFCVIGSVQTVYLRPDELIEVWSNIEEDAIDGSRQRDPTEEEDEQHEVRIGG